MKRLILLISVSVLCFSCTKNSDNSYEGKKRTADTLAFEVYSDTINLLIGDKYTMPGIDIAYHISYPITKDKLLIKNFIANSIGNEYANKGSLKEAATALTEDLIDTYKLDIQDYVDNGFYDDPFMNYSYDFRNEILYNTNNILSYSTLQYTYTGGAHGLVATTCCVYDIEKNVEMDLNSIFKSDALPHILSLIKGKLAEKEKNEEIDVDMNYVDVTENFYVDKDGIHWIYNPYEIAAYCFGMIEVTLPYSEIEKYFIEDTAIKRIYK